MKKTLIQFGKFSAVGFLNTGLDFCTYTFLTRLFIFWGDHKVLATTIAFIIANINSYILNKYWTFQNKDKKHHIQYSKFLIISIVGLLLTDIIFSIILHFGVYDLIAKLMPVPIVLFWNFAANRLWTFNYRQK